MDNYYHDRLYMPPRARIIFKLAVYLLVVSSFVGISSLMDEGSFAKGLEDVKHVGQTVVSKAPLISE